MQQENENFFHLIFFLNTMSKFKIELDLNYESFIFSSNLTNSALTMTIRVEVF